MKSLLRAMAVCATVLFAPCIAAAQNNQLSASNGVVDAISTADMMSVLGEIGFETKFVGEDQGGTKHIQASLDGGVVYFAMRKCNGSGLAALCQLIQPYGFFQGAGVTLAQVNDYNLNRSQGAVSGLLDNGNGIVGTKIYLVGGVAPEHFGFNIALFFKDIDILVQSIKAGALATVSYKIAPGEDRSFDGLSLPAGDYETNAVGRTEPLFVNDKVRAILDRGEKIRN